MFWLIVVIVVFALAFVAGYQIGYHDGWVETLPVSGPSDPVVPNYISQVPPTPRQEWEKRH